MVTGTINLSILGGIFDSTNPPGVGFTAANRPYLLFDGTTDELITWTFQLPQDYNGDLTLFCQYSMDYAVGNNVAIRTEVMAIADTEDIDTDNYASVEASIDDTVPATPGNMSVVSDTLTTPTLAAGDYIALRFGRENTTSGNNANGDMEVWNIWLEYTSSIGDPADTIPLKFMLMGA